MSEKTSKIAAWAVIGLFLIINLANLRQYGLTYDEGRAFWRGQHALQLAGSYVGLSQPLSQHDAEFLDNAYHPTFYASVSYAAASLATKLGHECVSARHYFNVLWATAGLVFLLLLVTRHWGPMAGFYAVLFLALFPTFIAHSHYNPKDVPFLSIAVAALYAFDVFLRRQTVRAAVMAGVLFGLSAATSLNALLLAPAFIAGLFVGIKPPKRGALFLFIWGGAAIAALYASWPILWTDPLYPWRSITFFAQPFMNNSVIYLGRRYDATTLPWHYTPVNFLAVIPLVTFAFFVYGLSKAFRDRSGDKKYLFAVLPLWFAVPILARLIPSVTRYDGMRHVFICVAPLVIFAGIGAARLLAARPRWKFVHALVPAWLLIEVLIVHPFEGSYVNEVTRLATRGHVERQFNLNVWAAPLVQGIRWLNENAPANAVVCSYAPHLIDCMKRADITLSCESNADFRIVVSEQQRQDNGLSEMEPVFAIRRYGVLLLGIFDLRLVGLPRPERR